MGSPSMGVVTVSATVCILTDITRLHSSRMRTARALTISPSTLCAGVMPGLGVPGLGGGCMVPGPWGCMVLGGCLVLGGCGIPACTEADPSVNRMTNKCKNMTLPQTSFAGGNEWYTHLYGLPVHGCGHGVGYTVHTEGHGRHPVGVVWDVHGDTRHNKVSVTNCLHLKIWKNWPVYRWRIQDSLEQVKNLKKTDRDLSNHSSVSFSCGIQTKQITH